MKKPNILFILTDQQRWDTVGCYGQKLDITPNLDLLASKGTRFEYAFTCQPVCGPARSCIQTGKYATRTGCHVNGIALGKEEKTIAHYLKEHGYRTGYIGKWHLATNGPEENYTDRGIPESKRAGYSDCWIASDALEATSHSYDGYMFDNEGKKKHFPPGRYRADSQTDWVLEYLQNSQDQTPFFLMVSYIEPHHQNDHARFEGPIGSKERFKDFEVPGDLKQFEGDWQKEYPDYLGCCAALDYNLGRIIDTLKEKNIFDDTIIIFTSDHGCHFKTRNFEYKRSCHDSSIRIPMVIHGKQFLGGMIERELVSLIDIAPTILDCAGVKNPDYMDGKPLGSLIGEEEIKWPQEVFVQISESQTGRAIRTKKYKYSVYVPGEPDWTTRPDSDSYQEQFLYDLEKDPHELNNLVSDPEYSDIRKRLKNILIEKMVSAGENRPEIVPA